MLNLHKTKDRQEILRDTRAGENKNKAPCLVLKYLSRSKMELLEKENNKLFRQKGKIVV